MLTHTQKMVRIRDIRMRVVEAGSPADPLLIFAHGWPESWYSWRHQIVPLAQAGYHVLAPDMRGYGGTDAPEDVAAYDLNQLVADMVGLVETTRQQQAVIVGHDWGAVVAWHAALLRPDRFCAVAALSVPYFERPSAPPTRIWQKRYGEDFYYILYHQQPGIAEAEYDTDPEGLLRMLYASPDTPREAPTITDPHRSAGGFIGRWGRPLELPAWLKPEDMSYYVAEFRRTGFRGGLNYYRNFDRNWALMNGVDPIIKVPALFIVGDQDLTISGMDQATIEERMAPVVPRLAPVEWIEGAGHWIQQECPETCNRALLRFLDKQV